MDYFYDGQIRRYFEQFIRIFSDLKYEYSRNEEGVTYRRVPIKMALLDRQVGHILKNNSENIALSVPQMSCWLQSLSFSKERIQTPNHISKVQVFERDIDPTTNEYTGKLGTTYTVERFMPIPYDMTMQLDIWTSNEMQKHELMEQIMILFNPSIDIQTGVNPIDWSSLTIVELQDVIWSNRSVPIGTEDQIDISSLTFKIPIWINPPSKVKKQNIIQNMYNNIINQENIKILRDDEGINWNKEDFITRAITSIGNHSILVNGNEITLLAENNQIHDSEGNLLSWERLFDRYAEFRPDISQIQLFRNLNDENGIIGTLSYTDESNKLLCSFDFMSLPANTLPPINGIIDPIATNPGNGLTAPSNGQRYLILEDINDNINWPNLTAEKNDIIQFVNGQWFRVFNSQTITSIHYVLNAYSNKQLRFENHEWVLSIDGIYEPGFWKLLL